MSKHITVPKHIFLFGHRKQHGKDTCCDKLEHFLKCNDINSCRTSFSKKLKKIVAKKYDLCYEMMQYETYKSYKPPHLKGKTVRDIIIDYGNKEKLKYKDVWAKYAIQEIMYSDCEVAMISDFRFPNEYESLFDLIVHFYIKRLYGDDYNNEAICLKMPKIHKILVHRPEGIFAADDADDQLPDLSDYWDYVIINNKDDNWEDILQEKTEEIAKKCLDLSK